MKKLLLTLILIPGMVLANGWNVGYTNIKDSEISVGALSGSYEWNHDNNWTTELGLVIGIGDDSYSADGFTITGEVNNGVFAKFKYDLNENFYAGIALARFSVDVSGIAIQNGQRISISGDETEQGITLGYKLSENFEISFDKMDDVDLFNVQYKF